MAPDQKECPVDTSCNTLNYYAESTTLQLTDSVFYIYFIHVPGTHVLQQSWFMENVNNLTFTGTVPSSERDEDVVVVCTYSDIDLGIVAWDGKKITLKNLEIFI